MRVNVYVHDDQPVTVDLPAVPACGHVLRLGKRLVRVGCVLLGEGEVRVLAYPIEAEGWMTHDRSLAA